MTLEEAYQKYYLKVFRFLNQKTENAALSEDLAQETFFLAARSWDKLRPDSNYQAWLYTIAKNLYITYLRRNQYFSPFPTDEEGNDLEVLGVPDTYLESSPLTSAVLQVASSKAGVTELLLSELKGYSYKEICQITGQPMHKIKSRIHRAKEAIREAYLQLEKDMV